MRWESLFADLEAQLGAAQAAEVTAQAAELARAERATVTLVARLRCARGAALTVRLLGGDLVTGVVLDVAEQWVLLGEGPRRALVPLAAVAAVAGLPASAAPAEGQVARRLRLGHALRALARDRVVVRIAVEGAEVVGRLDGVGADHVDVTALGEGPRPRPLPAGTGGTVPGWSVPVAAIRVVRSG